jgi:muconolactone delta-isomerase
MKFLSICNTKDNISMVPPANLRQLLEANLEWTNQQKKAGKILEIYALPDNRSVAICEHPSVKDLNQTLASMPIGAFMHFEVYPAG